MVTDKMEVHPEVLEAVVIRFVGDSGDGMQLTGTQFSDTSAMFGNDIAKDDTKLITLIFGNCGNSGNCGISILPKSI